MLDDKKSTTEIDKIILKLQSVNIPANLREKALEQIDRISLILKYGGNLSQIDITSKYVDWITSVPWNSTTNDLLDIKKAKEILDKNHFGLEKIKNRILEYLSILIIHKANRPNEQFHAPSLFFVGLAGTGKTTFAISIAEALGRKFVRIPFGGLSSALDLRGQSKASPDAQPGAIIQALRRVGTKNPVILLDELDRVTPEARSAVMGVLIELLDPGQNNNFEDYFLDYPVDLSQVLFVATANNTNNISTAVMDRLEVIQMPSYSNDEKITIAKKYLFPRCLQESGLNQDQVQIDENLWEHLTRPLGFDAGLRTLTRTIETIVRKAAFKIVSGQSSSFIINQSNIKEFL